MWISTPVGSNKCSLSKPSQWHFFALMPFIADSLVFAVSLFNTWLLYVSNYPLFFSTEFRLHWFKHIHTLFPYKNQALYWPRGCINDSHGLLVIYGCWSKISSLPLKVSVSTFGSDKRYRKPDQLINWFLLQLCLLSAILTVFFCGIVMSHYTWHNVTEKSRVTTKYVILFFTANTGKQFRCPILGE